MKMQTGTLSFSDEAVKALRNAGAISVIMSTGPALGVV